MSKKKIALNFNLPVVVPGNFELTVEEKNAMTLRAAEFILWELNEMIQRKTGQIQWLGVTPLQAEHEGEKDNAN